MSALDVLQSHKLARIAEALCREMSLRTMAELAGLTDAEIERISWLTPQQNKKLKALCETCRRGDPALLEHVWTERRLGSRHTDIHALLAIFKTT
jgi:hypothetical protein